MPKKKKTQQKPIHRGFAVTSIPKKAPPERRDDSDAKVESASVELSHIAQTHEPVEDETLSRQRAEEQSLQGLVDRLQERTEKEIVRTIKVRGCPRDISQKARLIRTFIQAIETERRFSNALPLLDLDAGIVSEILEMARGSWSAKGICLSLFRGILADMSY
jgi:ATP-dependent RNA helicase DHX29